MIKQIKVRRGMFYVFGQLAGSLCAAFIAWILLMDDQSKMLHPPSPVNSSAATGGAISGGDIVRALVAETVYTCCLVSVVLHVACSRQRDNNHYGLAIGMTVLSSAFSVGKISGGSFNPAVATGLHIQKCFTECENIQYLWIYWLGPIIGSGLAALLFTVVHALEEEEQHVYQREEDGKNKPLHAAAESSAFKMNPLNA